MNRAIFPSIQNQKKNQKDESFLVTKELSRPKLLLCLSNTNLLVISIIGMQKKQIASKKWLLKVSLIIGQGPKMDYLLSNILVGIMELKSMLSPKKVWASILF